MKTAVRLFAESVAEMYLAKSKLGYAPSKEIEEFAGLLSAVDWSKDPVNSPPKGNVPRLRHLPSALSAPMKRAIAQFWMRCASVSASRLGKRFM